MSAEIIRFIPRPNRNRVEKDPSTIAFRAATQIDDLTMDHADTAPCKYITLISSIDRITAVMPDVRARPFRLGLNVLSIVPAQNILKLSAIRNGKVRETSLRNREKVAADRPMTAGFLPVVTI